MTRAGTDNRDRSAGSATTAENTEARSGVGQESQGDLVERLRQNAVQLLAGVPRPPRSLRMRAGAVSVDVEWADEPIATVDRPLPEAGPTHVSSGNRETARTVVVSTNVDGGRYLHYLTAPTVGTFYRAPQPSAPPFVAEGDTVTVRQQVGIIEAMKVMIPVEADIDGRVVEVLKGDGEPVEYGERLVALAVEPEAGAS